jgi:drug/metabolite transporter (DMT)-like permease
MTLRTQASIKLLIAMVAISFVITLAKKSLLEVPFYSFIWLQMVIAILAMLVYMLFIRKETLWVTIKPNVWFMLLGVGLLNYCAVRFFFIFSLDLLPVTTHAYLMNFVGIVTMFLSAILLNEKPKLLQVLGGAIAVLGLWVFFYEKPKGGELIGIISISFAVVCLALTNILIRKLQISNQHQLSHHQIATLSVCIGGIPLVIVGLMIDFPVKSMSAEDWLVIALNGVVANAFAMTIFSQVMQYLKAYEASIIAMSGIVFTALFAMPLLNDYLNSMELAGIGFMIVGIGLVQYQYRQLSK